LLRLQNLAFALQEETGKLWHKQVRASTFHSWNANDLLIVVRILLLQDGDRSLAPDA